MNMPQTITTASPLYMWGRNHNQTADFSYIDWHKLVELIRKPVDLSRLTPKQAKQQCPFILPSDALRKTKDAVQAHDNYTLLIADIDTGDLSLSGVVAKVKALGVESFAIYSTLSHCTTDPEKGYKGRRWRVVIELSESVNTEHWNALQGYLCQRLDGDNCATRNQQIAYAPAIGKAKYEHYIQTGNALDPNDINHSFVGCAIAWDNELKASVAAIEAAKPKAAPTREAKLKEGQISPVAAFNDGHTVEDLLPLYGYRNRGRKWLHPNSTSGIPGVVLLNGRYYSHHSQSTDPLADKHTHDAFDLFVAHEHGGDFDGAVKAVADSYKTPNGITITQHNQREYMRSQSPQSDFTGIEISEDESALSWLKRFSLNGQSKEMELKMQFDVFVLGRLALLGQATIFYAPPNCGKTLITLRLLIDAIKEGAIEPQKCFYLNADDHYKGLVSKIRIAEQYGFQMLAPGHKGFKSSDLAAILEALTAKQEAGGAVLILDTFKKFTDLMDKQAQTTFLTVVRSFVSAGGTVIALAHTNKHRNGDGKLVHAGTADSIQDLDAAYIVDVLSDDNGTRIVEFTSEKVRGDNIPKVAYRYTRKEGQPYTELLDSVVCIEDEALKVAREEASESRQLDADAGMIAAICEVLGNQTIAKGDLVKAVQLEAAYPRRKILDALERYTGNNPFNPMHKWELVNGEKNVKAYRVVSFGHRVLVAEDEDESW
ncbi:MAG: AAA family ATPase [Hahellaceae bacterium]|nr:AAA family ATPase [Hahellaceae bacterium]